MKNNSHLESLEVFAKKSGMTLHPLDVRQVLIKMRNEKFEMNVRAAFEKHSIADLNEAIAHYTDKHDAEFQRPVEDSVPALVQPAETVVTKEEAAEVTAAVNANEQVANG